MQQLKVVNIVRRGIRVEEPGLLIKRVGEGVRGTRGHDDVVAFFSVHDLAVWCVEAECAFGHEEGFVVHFVPVGWWAFGAGRDDEFGRADAVVWGFIVSKLIVRGDLPVTLFFTCVYAWVGERESRVSLLPLAPFLERYDKGIGIIEKETFYSPV